MRGLRSDVEWKAGAAGFLFLAQRAARLMRRVDVAPSAVAWGVRVRSAKRGTRDASSATATLTVSAGSAWLGSCHSASASVLRSSRRAPMRAGHQQRAGGSCRQQGVERVHCNAAPPQRDSR